MRPSSARCIDAARALARHLLAARAGRLDRHAELGSPSTVVTSLPLAWSVELAIRAIAAGCPDGSSLLRTLAAWLPSPTRREVEWLAAHGDATCQAGAARLLEDLRDLTQEPLMHRRARPAATAVRRCRDLEPGTATQPGAHPARPAGGPRPPASRADLRPALARPRAAARPPRTSASRSAGFDGCSNRTAPPASRRRGFGARPTRSSWPDHHSSTPTCGGSNGYLAEADQAQQIGDSTEEVACLARAVDLWRGDPLVDLASIDELERRGRVHPPLARRRMPAARRATPRRRPVRRVAPMCRAEPSGVAVLRASAPTRDRMPSPAPRPLRTGVRRAVDPKRCSPSSGRARRRDEDARSPGSRPTRHAPLTEPNVDRAQVAETALFMFPGVTARSPAPSRVNARPPAAIARGRGRRPCGRRPV